MPALRAPLLTLAAMLAFAANSLLGRLALSRTGIDPASFTAIRLGAGASMLSALYLRGSAAPLLTASSWGSALALFAYAATFSFAYVRLHTGVGALLLFGAVQLTMAAGAVARGERLGARAAAGFAVSLAGLLGLTLPGAAPPDALGAGLMLASGASWGVYSLRGRGSAAPGLTTAGNFVRSVPFALSLWLAGSVHASLPWEGVAWAVLSGALTSGLGYVLWYAALRGLLASHAAIVQLSVPVLASALGVVVLREPLTPRLLGAGATILVGIALAVTAGDRR